MTQMGIEYMKALNQRDANTETQRYNRAQESMRWAELGETARQHDLQRQTSLDVAATQAATNRYAADLNAKTSLTNAALAADASKYNADKNFEKGTITGAFDAGGGLGEGIANVVGFLWDTII